MNGWSNQEAYELLTSENDGSLLYEPRHVDRFTERARFVLTVCSQLQQYRCGPCFRLADKPMYVADLREHHPETQKHTHRCDRAEPRGM